MPTVSVPVKVFNQLIGRSFTHEELEDLCFEFGIEIEFEDQPEEVKQEEVKQPEKKKEKGQQQGGDNKQQKVEAAPFVPSYSFEVASNRYDLLSAEGIAKTLGVFLGLAKMPTYKVAKLDKPREQLIVKSSTKQIRPFVVGAILRNITLTEDSYASFIDFQDKLHQNICRKRTLVAIGTHDLDTVKGPFIYSADAPKDIKFAPLNQTEVMDGNRLMEFYQNDLKLREYLYIIKDSPVYPVIYDQNKVVLSLPPIINGDHSKIKLTTKNIFIESTATDLTRARNALNILVSTFSQYCASPFEIEEVEVVYEDNIPEKYVTPDIQISKIDCNIDYVNNRAGINIDVPTCQKLLAKMGFNTTVKSDKIIEVEIDMSRTDIMHQCDIAEEVAIAYGFNKIVQKIPQNYTQGGQTLLNKASDLLRMEMASAGYQEVLNFILCSKEDISTKIQRPDQSQSITIFKSKTQEFQTARITLVSGLLKTLQENKKQPLPINMFEIGDVVLKTNNETGAKNERRLCALQTNTNSSGFEYIHGLLDYIMVKLKIPNDKNTGYSIQESNDGFYFPSRQAHVLYKNQIIGGFGIVHPNVLKNFEWTFPTSCIELNVEILINDVFGNNQTN